ncbi:transcriptional regulator, TetR family protein (plasmid) [Rhodococcus jostii RHA1]|jgi:AcrR family transcriptional regulator|uniref:Transcriptional regulator, TetR family protein n=2 Tax=Rhodococcus TaxID=1827 RepID=Q0RZA6_RHOJR|nr:MULTISPECIES: TetR family transcriptional regulator [Rhodococcus]ABG99380.1 transcriptional regulator, TetR family protein [Rhodococcus jostii RHA1]EID79537.1 TetR family transcriptional regulator [Rhodococcus opacus RKJ300 = JCM 13270]QQZ18600.1 helix-turn-helix transcriptional regulator [Rhodococcus sp. 21391]
MPRLSADARRHQLLEAALSVAEDRGIGDVSLRAVAEAAGVSLGLLHYRFADKNELIAAMADALIVQISDGLRLAFGQIASAPHLTGVDGLRRVLQTGIGALVPILESTAGRQLLTYEITTTALRRRDTGDSDGGQVADRQYRTMDTEAVDFLHRCAERTGTTWRIPVSLVARSALAGLDGLVLRWLVDRNTDALITGLDDLISMITVKAIASPIDATPAVRPISRA